jgi:adenosylhomocysteine nucleosidase
VLETPEAKAQCARETGALAVDMESATVAAFCREKGVPFLALRAISDTAGDSLPVPSEVWFDARTQRARPWGLFLFLLGHPGRIQPFVRFVLTIRHARRTLTAALLELFAAL